MGAFGERLIPAAKMASTAGSREMELSQVVVQLVSLCAAHSIAPGTVDATEWRCCLARPLCIRTTLTVARHCKLPAMMSHLIEGSSKTDWI